MEVNLHFKIIFSLFFFCSICVFSQAEKRIYTSTNILEIYINTEEDLIHYENGMNSGWGLELNSLHGIFILKKIGLSAGIGLNFNFNEDYKSLPAIVEVKFHLNDYGINSPYISLNTGKNVAIGSFLSGQTAKLGFGYNFESDYSYQYTIELFKKSKTYYTSNSPGINYDYPADGYGISMGITF